MKRTIKRACGHTVVVVVSDSKDYQKAEESIAQRPCATCRRILKHVNAR